MAVILVVEGAAPQQFVYRTSYLAELAAYLHALTHPQHHHGSRDAISSAVAELPPQLLAQIRRWAPIWGVQRARFLFPLDMSPDLSFEKELEGVQGYPDGAFLETVAKCIIESLRNYSAQFPETKERLEQDLLFHTERLSTERSELAKHVLDDPGASRDEIVKILHAAGTHPHFQREWNSIQPMLRGDVMHRQRQLELRGGTSLADVSDRARVDAHPQRVVFDKIYHASAKVKDQSVVSVPSFHCSPHLIVKHVRGLPVVVQYPVQRNGAVSFELMTSRLKALNDPVRVQICYHILREPRATVDLALTLGMSAAQISRKLRKLREVGLVIGERDGRLVRYRMNIDCVRQLGDDFINTLLY